MSTVLPALRYSAEHEWIDDAAPARIGITAVAAADGADTEDDAGSGTDAPRAGLGAGDGADVGHGMRHGALAGLRERVHALASAHPLYPHLDPNLNPNLEPDFDPTGAGR